jgi:hypothetical protein
MRFMQANSQSILARSIAGPPVAPNGCAASILWTFPQNAGRRKRRNGGKEVGGNTGALKLLLEERLHFMQQSKSQTD